MSEWWTYSLSDFLMFSARTYYRQFELMNRELWPLQLLAIGAGAAILACLLRPRPAGTRIVFALLGMAWLWVGWAYHLQRYADINTGAPYFAAAFFLQAGLLAGMAWRAPAPQQASDLANRIAPAFVLLALAGYPALTVLEGRSWKQAELFAFAPDPTVILTLGALMFWRVSWPMWVIPLLWCAVSSATLSELHAARAWAPVTLALLALAAALWAGLTRQRQAAHAPR